MATIKLGNTKIANRLITYVENKAVEHSGVDCDPEFVREQFKTTRGLHGKQDGVQAHHVIQSFKPGEVAPDVANQIGIELAQEIAKGHEAVVYTHVDKKHVHNHIVINAVNFETGKKYQSKRSDLFRIRELSDKLCEERGLSVVKESAAKVRYTLTEKNVLGKGLLSWKDELRHVIDFEKANSKNYEEFKANLKERYGIEVNDTRKHITYKHPDHSKVVRGNKLGNDYEKDVIKDGFGRIAETSRTIGIVESNRIDRTTTKDNLRPRIRASIEHLGDFQNDSVNRETDQNYLGAEISIANILKDQITTESRNIEIAVRASEALIGATESILAILQSTIQDSRNQQNNVGYEARGGGSNLEIDPEKLAKIRYRQRYR